ncbi:carbon starvation CstA family protein [Oscillibacter sp.]|uniref:carbon starvation CstA family protein n=1 Tax=Oscillibacter sp. TaxID=1945593 RepID=UPI0026298935|nr:carbon starvation CstA family protein [Oscillibacter sp.]MDD3346835.1 carbon starvation CstA family protein [Oscillibacter sp.]
MATFIIGLVILFGGAALYGKLCEKVFGPDDRETPAYSKQDGVDYVPMKSWKNQLINLLNIAGTGPIFGPIQGILFGPIAFITIPLGNVIGGAMHDYFSGMICLRDGGTQMPEMIRRYSNKGVYNVYRVFVSVLLLLVGAVFIYTPGDIAATQVFGFSGAANAPSTWIIYGVIFAYYLIATVFPIDAIIGRIYPVFGAILLFSALGVFGGLFIKGYPLLNLWDNWQSPALAAFTMAADGATQVPFSYGDYFTVQHFVPIFFITVACGILSGFHSTQTAIISRTMKSEREGRKTFYNMMVLEGFIAMIWAAAAMGVYNLGLQQANPSMATGTVGIVCRDILGNVGGIIALLGIIVLPITSGDTALRGLRLTIAESFHIDQSTNAKRLTLSTVIFALVAAILVFAKTNSAGFNILWRYFAWSNQTLSLFAFLAISVWMYESGKSKFVWMPLIPGAWYAFVTITYIMNAHIGFNLPWGIAYAVGALTAAAYVIGIVWYGKKRAARLPVRK